MFLIACIAATIAIGASLISGMYDVRGDGADIWWTPRTTPLPITDPKAAASVEIYLDGKPLAHHLAEGSVRLYDGHRYAELAPRDFSVRINGWHEKKTEILLDSIKTGALLTGGVVLALTVGVAFLSGK